MPRKEYNGVWCVGSSFAHVHPRWIGGIWTAKCTSPSWWRSRKNGPWIVSFELFSHGMRLLKLQCNVRAFRNRLNAAGMNGQIKNYVPFFHFGRPSFLSKFYGSSSGSASLITLSEFQPNKTSSSSSFNSFRMPPIVNSCCPLMIFSLIRSFLLLKAATNDDDIVSHMHARISCTYSM